jgi:hypothetical protein
MNVKSIGLLPISQIQILLFADKVERLGLTGSSKQIVISEIAGSVESRIPTIVDQNVIDNSVTARRNNGSSK